MKKKNLILICITGLLVSIVIVKSRSIIRFLKHNHTTFVKTTHFHPKGLRGIDVSHYQKNINWNKIDTTEVNFVFIKSTEGVSLTDRKFKTNMKEASKRDLLVGAYHYFHVNKDVKKQFENFNSVVEKNDISLPPLLDIEDSKNMKRSEIISKINEWLKLVEKHYNTKSIIYTTQRFYNTYLQGSFKDYKFIIARYNTKPPYLIDKRDYDFWQYTDKGQINGISVYVDLQVFSGDKKELKNLYLK